MMKTSLLLLALPALALACETTPPAKSPCPEAPRCEQATPAPVANASPPPPEAPPSSAPDLAPTATSTSTTSAPAPTAAPLPAGEWSLVDRETWTAYQSDANDWATDVTKSCGATISGRWNAESFRKHMSDLTKDRYSRQRCQSAFESLATICRQGDMQKQALVKKIKSAECVWGPDKSSGAKLDGSKLVVTIDTGKDASTPDYVDIVRKSL